MSGLRRFSIVEGYDQRKSEKYGTDWQPNNTAKTCMICDKVRPLECEVVRRHLRGNNIGVRCDHWVVRPCGPGLRRSNLQSNASECHGGSDCLTTACTRTPSARSFFPRVPSTLLSRSHRASPQAWSLTRRRHHCRMCGSLVCGSCSSHKVKLESSTNKKRVCSTCFARQALGHIAQQVTERPRTFVGVQSAFGRVPVGVHLGFARVRDGLFGVSAVWAPSPHRHLSLS